MKSLLAVLPAYAAGVAAMALHGLVALAVAAILLSASTLLCERWATIKKISTSNKVSGFTARH